MIYHILCLLPVVTLCTVDLAFCLILDILAYLVSMHNLLGNLIVVVLCQVTSRMDSISRFLFVDWEQFRNRQQRRMEYFCKIQLLEIS